MCVYYNKVSVNNAGGGVWPWIRVKITKNCVPDVIWEFISPRLTGIVVEFLYFFVFLRTFKISKLLTNG